MNQSLTKLDMELDKSDTESQDTVSGETETEVKSDKSRMIENITTIEGDGCVKRQLEEPTADIKMEINHNIKTMGAETLKSQGRDLPVTQDADDWLTAFYLHFDRKSPPLEDDCSSASESVQCTQKKTLTTKVTKHRQDPLDLVSKSKKPSRMTLKQKRKFQSEPENFERRFPCSQCKAAFPFYSKLQRHMQSHTGKRPFPCSQCKATFSCQSNLKTHERTHTGERPFSCPHCDSAFSSSSNLKLHLRVHTGERPFPCNVCTSAFKSSTELRRHERVHTGERPYTCNDCGLTFTQASSLSSHRKKHTGEKMFVCIECDARFTASGYLKTHSRTHTGVKPYACGECSALFAQSSSLKKHVQAIHTKWERDSDQQYLCTVCRAIFSRKWDLIKHEKIHEQSNIDKYSEKRPDEVSEHAEEELDISTEESVQ